MPSDIDIHATAKCIADLLLVAKIRRSEKRIGIIANRVRINTRVSQSLTRFLNSLDIPLIATLRDTQNYVRSAEIGIGVCEMPRWQVQQDLPQWQQILSWLAAPTPPDCGERRVDGEAGFDRTTWLGAERLAGRAARRLGNAGRPRVGRFGLAVLPGLADLVRPRVVAAPAVDRVIERRALARRFRADPRQPLAVRVPAVLLVVRARARRQRRSPSSTRPVGTGEVFGRSCSADNPCPQMSEGYWVARREPRNQVTTAAACGARV